MLPSHILLTSRYFKLLVEMEFKIKFIFAEENLEVHLYEDPEKFVQNGSWEKTVHRFKNLHENKLVP